MNVKEFDPIVFKEIIDLIPQIIKNSKICLERELLIKHDNEQLNDHRLRFRKVVKLFEGKWTVDVLFLIFRLKSPNYNTILKSIPGINSRTLTDRLRLFENYKIINRLIKNTQPIRVKYEMTEMGKDICYLLLPVILIGAWPEILEKRHSI